MAPPTARTSTAPCAPHVTATASADHDRSTARPTCSGPPPCVAALASARFGVATVTPGTGAGPRGCGSHTTGTPARTAAASAARTVGSAATPRP